MGGGGDLQDLTLGVNIRNAKKNDSATVMIAEIYPFGHFPFQMSVRSEKERGRERMRKEKKQIPLATDKNTPPRPQSHAFLKLSKATDVSATSAVSTKTSLCFRIWRG